MKKLVYVAVACSVASINLAFTFTIGASGANPFQFQWFEPGLSMWMQGGFGNSTFSPGKLDFGGKDYAYQISAWYRAKRTSDSGQPREYQVCHFDVSTQASPSTGIAHAFEEVNGVGNVLDFDYVFTLRSMGPKQAVLHIDWKVTNKKTGAADIYDVNYFPYLDMQCHSAENFNDTLVYNTGQQMFTYTNTNNANPQLFVRAMSPAVSAYQAGFYQNVRTVLSNMVKDSILNNQVPPSFYADDQATDFQHIFRLQPGASQSGVSAVGVGIVPTELAPASGNAMLGGFLGDPSKQTMRVQLYQPGTSTLVETIDVAGSASGNFNTTLMSRGSYDITVKGTHWLSRKISNVNVTNAGLSGLNFGTLINGDINDDNTVDQFDYLRLSAAFDTVKLDLAYDAMADLNGDDTVDQFDYLIMSESWEMVGE
ncbi:MAG: hypothetical protein JNM85_10945 [Chthonomonas sp.]|nr:hypothetical protein [Chthonomonas sp.]